MWKTEPRSARVSQLETEGARFVSGASPDSPAGAVFFLLFREIVTRITATVATHATSPQSFQSKVTSGSGGALPFFFETFFAASQTTPSAQSTKHERCIVG